jgi:nucleotide-binding universal stress UspA family protein
MYNNILIATDGSKPAARAVKHGLKLAKAAGCPVTFVSVTDNWSGIEMARQATPANPNPIIAYEKAAASAAGQILAAAEAQAAKANVSCKTIHVKDRHPAEGIVDTAGKLGCDLIVLASHGRRGIQKLLLGSVTTEVLTRASIPVLVVK